MTRPDHDEPQGDEVYVLRLEDARGRRAKVTVSAAECDVAIQEVGGLRRVLVAKAAVLIDEFQPEVAA